MRIIEQIQKKTKMSYRLCNIFTFFDGGVNTFLTTVAHFFYFFFFIIFFIYLKNNFLHFFVGEKGVNIYYIVLNIYVYKKIICTVTISHFCKGGHMSHSPVTHVPVIGQDRLPDRLVM